MVPVDFPTNYKNLNVDIVNDVMMAVLGCTRTTVRLLLVAVVMGLVSLALPWWTLILFVEVD